MKTPTQILKQAVSDNYRQASYHLKGTAVTKQDISITEMTLDEYVAKFSQDELTKVLQLSGHERIGHTRETLNTTVELEGYCISGTCSNCSGIRCAKFKIPTELIKMREFLENKNLGKI